MSVFLVLPADKLESHSAWLSVHIQQSLTVNARNIEQKPKKPILFFLDEMPALGRLPMVEQAFGLMAGLPSEYSLGDDL
ncbi:type IV secretory system conjugative DNA transfer family protein [Hoeflea poritis]|uniref:Type IV secretory system conjugative DNA transfer family protein n=1 Tax=Hoeflea poritis TaxID=2993659 RepID=A0ABT4VV71_9HYPH|nr:type IV secretory system conjugative DNA transfer family protein [Hoeflea poritis]MDA4848593.1 type IV secretory system conjugative DNA transfer family protein [Hoeflea poritis]